MAVDFSQDAVNNAIYNGILRGIDIAIKHKCFGSAIILLLPAIDAMAYLAMPETQGDVTKAEMSDYVPATDANFSAWLKTVLADANGNLAAPGLALSDIAPLQAVVTAFDTAPCGQRDQHRGAPQVGFSPHILRIRPRTSHESVDRVVVQASARNMQFSNCRFQRETLA